MLHDTRISEIALEAARRGGANAGLERVMTEPTLDSEGKDAVRITLVLTPDAVQSLTGDEALDILVSIQQSLSREGEERFPIGEYATEGELEEAKDASAKKKKKSR